MPCGANSILSPGFSPEELTQCCFWALSKTSALPRVCDDCISLRTGLKCPTTWPYRILLWKMIRWSSILGAKGRCYYGSVLRSPADGISPYRELTITGKMCVSSEKTAVGTVRQDVITGSDPVPDSDTWSFFCPSPSTFTTLPGQAVSEAEFPYQAI